MAKKFNNMGVFQYGQIHRRECPTTDRKKEILYFEIYSYSGPASFQNQSYNL